MPQQQVTVIFKTHLDIGFTELADHVVKTYVEQFIPKALDLAARFRAEGRPQRFIWTTGSWLIHHYLEVADAAGRQRMEEAIAHGDLAWHALPFTWHSELCSVPLFRSGLAISRRLDARFGRQTIAAKMTDVPGHTRGIVPLLAEAGVRFLHLGNNPSSRSPDVPDLFRWQAGGAEIVVGYNHDYGTVITAPNGEAIQFLHSADNHGPQTHEQVVEAFAKFGRDYPGKQVVGGTMDDFARRIEPVVAQLPIISDEIGDTWIHGASSDPQKVARFKHLERLRASWLAAGRIDEPALERFDEHLALVAEHTWGVDHKSFHGDVKNWWNADFDRARAKDQVDVVLLQGFEYAADFTRDGRAARLGQRYSVMERSWQEQRGYLDAAVASLPAELKAEAEQPTVPPRRSVSGPARVGETLRVGSWALAVDERGALVSAKCGDLVLADASHPLGLLRYQTHDHIDYCVFRARYPKPLPGQTWPEADFGKIGLGHAGIRRGTWTPRLAGMDVAGDAVTLALSFEQDAIEEAGAPATMSLQIRPAGDCTLLLDLCWHDKRPTRIPESMWMQAHPPVEARSWRLIKLGHEIDPRQIRPGGNRMLHAVESLKASAAGTPLTLEPLDTPVVSVQGTSILDFPQAEPTLAEGVWVNLFNTVWGTNFTAWIAGESRARLRVTAG
jgi:hypothetical protein